MTEKTAQREILDLMRDQPGPTVTVPKNLLMMVMTDCYAGSDIATAGERALSDSRNVARAEAAIAAALGPNDRDGAPLLRLGPGGDFTRDWPATGERDDYDGTEGGFHDE